MLKELTQVLGQNISFTGNASENTYFIIVLIFDTEIAEKILLKYKTRAVTVCDECPRNDTDL